ncbi:MAG: DUF5596 domain-containing protein [Lachnospiraceae bacterium]|nr:DUF5596 domain-containing protein [Lachnospiraceae bacterium]MBQ7780557.1 DUF5596 domain-containing protein [Lachnospiraceae bacterium]
MWIKNICELIEMPAEAVEQIISAAEEVDKEALGELIKGLTVPDSYAAAQAGLEQKLGEDKRGFKMLACMLAAAELTKDNYVKKRIGEDIFADTMKCFTRFVSEYKESYGVYGFDRAFWTGRQLSMLLFRIGELEYEFVDATGRYKRKVIDMHIPSDAVLVRENCHLSYMGARTFIAKHFPEHTGEEFVCCSWLLSPALEELLSENARINCFRKEFEITEWEKDSTEFLQWVFKREDIPIAELPEDTSLQRRMKQYLLQGGKVGEAMGRLKGDWH